MSKKVTTLARTTTQVSSATTAYTLRGASNLKAAKQITTDTTKSGHTVYSPKVETSQFSLDNQKGKQRKTVADFDLKLTGKRQSPDDLGKCKIPLSPNVFLESLETYTQSLSLPALTLRLKGSQGFKSFCVFAEDQLKGVQASEAVSKFDMSKLENEYDYDTEAEQMHKSAKMLTEDLLDAI